jgi:predicted RNase H-like HicB family nuclease
MMQAKLEKEEIDLVVMLVLEHCDGYLQEVKSEIEETGVGTRFEMPFFHPKPFHRDFMVEIAMVPGSVYYAECINMPGVIETGNNFDDAIHNITRAIIECADARLQVNRFFLNRRVSPRKVYGDATGVKVNDFIEGLDKEGWKVSYEGPYHLILINSLSVVTFSVPRVVEINAILKKGLLKYINCIEGVPLWKIRGMENDND